MTHAKLQRRPGNAGMTRGGLGGIPVGLVSPGLGETLEVFDGPAGEDGFGPVFQVLGQ